MPRLKFEIGRIVDVPFTAAELASSSGDGFEVIALAVTYAILNFCCTIYPSCISIDMDSCYKGKQFELSLELANLLVLVLFWFESCINIPSVIRFLTR